MRASLVLVTVAQLASAQAPTVSKVEPPNWWAGHSINPVRLLVRGTQFTGAKVSCPARLTCGTPKTNANGTYLFVDVSVPAGTPTGAYPIAISNAAGRASFDFTVSAALPSAGRFQGFGVDDAMYLIMPDRFVNGDTTNDRPAGQQDLIDRTKGRYYHGGDIAGVRQKLPYLKSLGITAIWLTPVYDNYNRINERERYDNQGVTDYHGYGAVDFYATDEHLGSLDEYRAMVDDAHTLGIKVVVDMVANHTGPYHPWVKDSPTPTWYHGTEANHPANSWQGWTIGDPYAVPELKRETLDGWFGGFLPDLNQDDPEVARYIIQNTLWWVGMSGVDGIRQDTWQYVPRSFWKPWMSAIKKQYPALKVVGEVFDGDPALISHHLDGTTNRDGIKTGLDYLFDFPLHFTLRSVFARGNSIRELAMMLGRDHVYADPNRLSPFVGNHDVERFMNERGATMEGLALANTFLLTTRGTPLLYYGDEIGLPGRADPDNRHDFPGGWRGDARDAFTAAGRTPAEQQLWAHLQKLLQLRAQQPDLRRGATKHLVAGNQLFVYQRGKFVVALNNDTAAVTAHIPIGMLGKDLLGICTAAPMGSGRFVDAQIPKRSGCIFPVTSEAVPGPSLGVTGELRHHPAFPSKLVAARNVDVWLPPGYATSGQRYPVLYLHDGQNQFDPDQSYGGVDWGIDETMTSLIKSGKVRPAIVVAVWNTPKRFEEYMPQRAVTAGDSMIATPTMKISTKGVISDAYLDFLVTELKPFIDKTYRTKTGPQDTFTMGSSMGGLISAYAVVRNGDTFGGAACISTHFPLGNGSMIEVLASSAPNPATHRLYFDRGDATLDAMYPPYDARLAAAMHGRGYVDGKSLMIRAYPGAEHAERAWRVRMETPLQFLLGR